MLLDLLTEDRILTKVKASDWRELVRISGGVLVRDGLVEEKYIDAMIGSIEKNGPYVVLTDGFALLHARPEDGVKEICMSLVTLDEPVEFGHKDFDPVKVAIAFGAVDNQQHLQALQELMKVLMIEGSVNEMYEIESSKRLHEYLEGILSSQE